MTEPKKKYSPFVDGRLNTSPSKINTKIECTRKWWFQVAMGLKEPPRTATTLGDVGHEVLGRYLEGKDGDDMYPVGWHKQMNRFTGKPTGQEINKAEQTMVKALVHNGILKSIVRREPDGEVEKNLVLEPDDLNIRIRMFLDYATQHSVEDHKFCKSARYYGKDKLKQAVAMNLYAEAQYQQGCVVDPTIWLRYNLFLKDPKKFAVLSVEVERTREEIQHHYNSVVMPACKGMLALWERGLGEEDWSSVAPPESERVCGNFGGCPFAAICSGRITVKQYREAGSASAEDRKKKERGALKALVSGSNSNKGDKKMGKELSFKEKMLAKRAAAAAGGAETAAPAAETPAAETPAAEQPKATAPAAEAPASDRPAAPWHNPGCKACEEEPILGIASNGNECKICRYNSSKVAGRPSPDDYTIVVNDDGSRSIVHKESGEIVAGAGAPEVREVPEVVEPVAQEPVEPETTPEPEPEPEVEEPPVVTTEEKPDTTPEPEATPEPEQPAEQPKKRKRRSVLDVEKDVNERVDALEAKIDGMPAGTGAARTSSKGTTDIGGVVQKVFDFRISYHPVQVRGDIGHVMGESNCVVHIAELLEMVHEKVIESKGLPEGSNPYGMNTFERRDVIMENIEGIAEALGASIVDASSAAPGTDAHVLAAALNRYACVAFGS